MHDRGLITICLVILDFYLVLSLGGLQLKPQLKQ